MKSNPAILVVDDEKDHADVLVEALHRQGSAVGAYSVEDALRQIDRRRFDIVIADLNLRSDKTGLDILDAAREKHRDTVVILITAYATIETCKQALRRGAYDYLVKPIDVDQLRLMVTRALASRKGSEPESDFVFPGVRSRSPAMKRIFHVLRRVAPTTLSVLIEGESGTGKELTARAIHDNSPRHDKPFRPINCAGLTESLLESELFGHVKGAFTGAATDRKGLFEVADKGTLFLDEIGDMPLSMQAKLLRVLEDGLVFPVGSTKPIVVDVRVISATNHDLAKLVEEKKFRQDLYFRIRGVSITLPPLRHRLEDIPELFGYFLNQTTTALGRDIHRITEAAMNILINFGWPGNIRQFRYTVQTMVVMCDSDTLDVQDIPPEITRIKQLSGQVQADVVAAPVASTDALFGKTLEEVEREHIANTLRLTHNNRAEAAKILQIGERTLYRKIKEYNL
ncbi:MAG: sigma-54-dependent Fis family transcriptional regulator [Phycisphaerae bacterium]|nr:sigma-54-dependent Fis family transcriptional regulator [Phycisphaerae bacterium]